jgi:hypothetical protein
MSSTMTAPLLFPQTKADVSPAARKTATASRLCWLISKFWGSFMVLRAGTAIIGNDSEFIFQDVCNQ